MSLPRYPEYKDSGVEWLGDVPAHWAVAPLKRGYDVRLGKMLQPARASDDDILAPYLRAANIQWGGVELESLKSMWFSPRERELLALKKGDLLVSEGGDVGRSSLWREELEGCYFQNSVNRVRSRGADRTDYLHYWMATIKSKGYVDVLCNKSTIAHFTAEKVEAVPTPYPSPEEQRQIAAFLDHATDRIDALIAEQEKLLVLLAEKRQATISHAVTRGLNPNVPMKDSGIAWLGEVPAHWKLTTLGKASTERCDGPFGSGIKSDHYTDDGVLVVRLQNIRAGEFNFGESAFLDSEYFEESLRRHEVRAGDLLVAGLGDDNNLVGRACVAPDGLGPALVKADCFRFRLHQGMALPDFVAKQLSAGAAFDAGELATGTTRSRIPLGVMATRKIALPPVREQREIVAFVNELIRSLDTLSAKAKRAAELLRERRSALISAAVTGQIDVRGLVEAEAI